MAGFIKPLMIGLFLMVGVLMGGLSFVSVGYQAYGINQNSSSLMLNNTIGYMNSRNSTAQVFDTNVKGSGALSLGIFSSIGLIFNNLGAFAYSFYELGTLLNTMINDLVSNSIIPIPYWLPGLIMGIFGVCLTVFIVSLWIGRSSDDT
jgi:hypothetical protein